MAPRGGGGGGNKGQNNNNNNNNNNKSTKNSNTSGGGNNASIMSKNRSLVIMLLICIVSAVIFNITSYTRIYHQIMSYSTTTGLSGSDNKKKNDKNFIDEQSNLPSEQYALSNRIAGLYCDKFGGPSPDIAAEMVYWRDIPSDANFTSPFAYSGPDPKYLTFEPDEGGWNNIRMSMETAVALAHAMGRILVLPPQHELYLLNKERDSKKNRLTFHDFFPLQALQEEHSGIQIISFQQFLQTEAMTGQLVDKFTGQVMFPPNNRTNWDSNQRARNHPIFHWLRNVTNTPIWNFDDCVAAFPERPEPGGGPRLWNLWNQIQQEPIDKQKRMNAYNNNPTPVDANPIDRLREMKAHRNNLCIYGQKMQQAKVIHMMGDNASGARLLVHFYAFLFFENYHHDLWTKRFVRDHLRYIDEIQCAAARVVHAVRQKAIEHGNKQGHFDSFHIRRGDFQYKQTRINATEILSNIQDVLQKGSTIYIATDERDKTFFELFRKDYHIYFLDDFKHLISTVSPNYFGMLDQRIASRGRTFIGAFYSTFTGYINRMRGYHSQKDKTTNGYEKGVIDSYYYVEKWRKYEVREYRSLRPPLWSREFPVGWRDIDHDIDPSIIMSRR